MTKEQIQQAVEIAGAEMLKFVERTGDDKKLFSGKIIVNETVGNVDFENDEVKTVTELSCVVFANQPQPQVVFNTTIEVSTATLEDGSFEAKAITAFPSAEEIEDAKKQHEEQLKQQQAQMQGMDGISPEQMQELMKTAGLEGESIMPADELPTSIVDEMVEEDETVEETAAEETAAPEAK